MKRLVYLLYLWPGLVGLVRYGRWPFWFVAVLFALMVDVLLIANFYWTEYLSPQGRVTLLALCAGFWGLLLAASAHFMHKIKHTEHSGDFNHFKKAVCHYLRGNWFEAECTLSSILRRNPRDVESLLLMATMYRRTERFVEAIETLRTLDRLEDSRRWVLEIHAEKELLSEYPKKPEHEA